MTATLAGGVAGGLLVAAGAAVVAARRAAAGAFFVLGAAAGMLTAWVERKLIGAEGAAFDLYVRRTLPDRRAGDLVLPGQALLAGGLDLPLPALADQPGGVVAIPVPGGGAAVAGVVGVRRRSRAPLAAAAFFRRHAVSRAWFFQCLSVPLFLRGRPFPILGEPGDHYVSSRRAWPLLLERCGTLEADRADGLAWRCWPSGRLDVAAKPDVHRHRDAVSHDDRRQSDCWMAYTNFGNIIYDKPGQLDEATGYFQKALALNPDMFEAHNSLAVVFARRGKIDQAVEHYQAALRLKPDLATLQNNFGKALLASPRLDEATAHFRRAVDIDPDYADAQRNLGFSLAAAGRLNEALGIVRGPCNWRATTPMPSVLSATHWPP